MSARRLAALFLLALAVPLAEAWLDADLALGSRTALALFPWLAFATAPRRPGEGTGAFLALYAALPPLGLAAGLDLAGGVDASRLAWAAAAGWLALGLWGFAAARAAGSASGGWVYAGLWFALVPGAFALRVALAWVPARAPSAPGGPDWLALDPLLFCHRFARAGGLRELGIDECAYVVLGGVLAEVAASIRGPAASARGQA